LGRFLVGESVMSSTKNLGLVAACLLLATPTFAFGQIKDEMLAVIPATQRPRFVTRLNLYIEYKLKGQEEKLKALYDEETLCSICLGKKECVDECSSPMTLDVPKGFDSQIVVLKPVSVEVIAGEHDRYKIKAIQRERVDYYGNGKHKVWKKTVSIEARFQNNEWYFSLIAEPANLIL
jgi:hypothetical protein